jgi:23S rRNA (cytidine1920-2'-O)/16S rRNA (cytidine1409-2'-O)-methyltransferase
VKNWLTIPGLVVALVKPQFEAGRGQVGKGGVVRDKMIHRQVLKNTLNFAAQANFNVLGLTISPVTGPAGNHEFLIYLGWETGLPEVDVEATINECLARL